MSEFLRASSALKGFLYLNVGDKETDQMVGGFTKLVDVLRKNRKKQFKWVADRTPQFIKTTPSSPPQKDLANGEYI